MCANMLSLYIYIYIYIGATSRGRYRRFGLNNHNTRACSTCRYRDRIDTDISPDLVSSFIFARSWAYAIKCSRQPVCSQHARVQFKVQVAIAEVSRRYF